MTDKDNLTLGPELNGFQEYVLQIGYWLEVHSLLHSSFGVMALSG